MYESKKRYVNLFMPLSVERQLRCNECEVLTRQLDEWDASVEKFELKIQFLTDKAGQFGELQ